MQYIKLGLYTLSIIVLVYCTVFLSADYQTLAGRNHMPFIIWAIDTINLFIHEAGHLIFKIFGKTIYFMGGSLFQVILPAVTAFVFARTNLRSLLFTLYWTGQNMVNVSIYIADAPFQRLHLISGGAIHDWHWIMINCNLMDDIDTIASIINGLGILTCIAGIGLGLFFFVYDGYKLFRNPQLFSL